MKAKPKTTYITASPATWELIRSAYLSGLSAPTAAARFGVSEGALRKRAGREGWTKRRFVASGGLLGLAAPGAAAPEPAGDAAPPAPDAALAALAARAMPGERRSALSVARTAVNQAAEALFAGDADTALRHVRAAEAIVRLEAIFAAKEDWGEEIEDAREAEQRQSAFSEFAFQLAGDLAGMLVEGKPVPPGWHARAEHWRAKYHRPSVPPEGAGGEDRAAEGAA